jgi:hypothetical protein
MRALRERFDTGDRSNELFLALTQNVLERTTDDEARRAGVT